MKLNGAFVPYMCRYKQAQGACLGKEALGVNGVDDGINLNQLDHRNIFSMGRLSPYRLALERAPYDGSVSDGKLGQAVAGEDAPFRNVKRVHDGDDVVAAGTGSLDVLEQLAGDQVVHVAPKVRRVQGDPALHIVEEEHDGQALKANVRSSVR